MEAGPKPKVTHVALTVEVAQAIYQNLAQQPYSAVAGLCQALAEAPPAVMNAPVVPKLAPVQAEGSAK